jgi:two-component system phosphate regulon response regulator OmpR
MVRILVVEDDAAIRQVLRRVLERAGYEVLLARTTIEGHRTLQTERVDVVITDINLPGSDGLQFTAEVRTVYPSIPIIAMTGADGRDELGLLGAALQFGAKRALRKPFSMDVLLEAIHACLQWPGENLPEVNTGKAG